MDFKPEKKKQNHHQTYLSRLSSSEDSQNLITYNNNEINFNLNCQSKKKPVCVAAHNMQNERTNERKTGKKKERKK